MSTACYDKKPEPNRPPIAIAGDLVRRSDRLSKEAAKCIQRLYDEAAMHYADLLDALALVRAAEEFKAGRISVGEFFTQVDVWKCKVVS